MVVAVSERYEDEGERPLSWRPPAPVKSGSYKKKKTRTVIIRLRDRHADMVAIRRKNFQIRFSPIDGPFEIRTGANLTIIRVEKKFSFAGVLSKGEMYVSGIFPITLSFKGVYLPNLKMEMPWRNVEKLIRQDGCRTYEEFATYYLTRRAAYFSFSKKKKVEDRVLDGWMMIWDYI